MLATLAKDIILPRAANASMRAIPKPAETYDIPLGKVKEKEGDYLAFLASVPPSNLFSWFS
jgi:hypothetical protein